MCSINSIIIKIIPIIFCEKLQLDFVHNKIDVGELHNKDAVQRELLVTARKDENEVTFARGKVHTRRLVTDKINNPSRL